MLLFLHYFKMCIFLTVAEFFRSNSGLLLMYCVRFVTNIYFGLFCNFLHKLCTGMICWSNIKRSKFQKSQIDFFTDLDALKCKALVFMLTALFCHWLRYYSRNKNFHFNRKSLQKLYKIALLYNVKNGLGASFPDW